MARDSIPAEAAPWMPKPMCGAATRSGGHCRRPAGEGSGHLGFGRCRLHGGSTPTHAHAAAIEMARAHVASLALPQPVEPHEALELAMALTLAEVEFFNAKIAELQDDDAMGPVVSTHTRPLSHGKDGESETSTVTEVKHAAPDLHIWIRARAQAIDRLARYAKLAADAGVAERRVRVLEGQAEQLADVLNAVMRDLAAAGLSAELRALAGASFDRHLALLDAVPGTATEVAA